MNSSCVSGADIFDGMLGGIALSSGESAIRTYAGNAIRVGVVKMAAPRHERFSMFLDMGMSDVDRVFSGEKFLRDSLTFVFPERYMSVHEQQCFMSSFLKHPHWCDIKKIDILTSSALMISNFYAAQIRILTWSDDETHNGVGHWLK